jgi:hypothetical protein
MKWSILLSKDAKSTIEHLQLNIEHWETPPVNQAVTKFSLSKRVKSKKGTKVPPRAFETILDGTLKIEL